MNKSKNNQSLIIQFLVSHLVILLLGIVIGILITFVGKSTASDNDIIVQMNIDYGDGNIQMLPFDIIPESTTVTLYMNLVSKRHGIPLDIRVIDETTYVESIHNIHRTQDIPWVFIINDAVTNTNPDDYYLKDGDTILWKR